MEIVVGMKGRVDSFVEREDTAQELGFGKLLVYATPCMIALMEGAAYEVLAEVLPEGKTSVGTEISVTHLSATPVGMNVYAEAEITSVENNTITFSVKAYDEAGVIGEGIHKRSIVNAQRFLDNTYTKI